MWLSPYAEEFGKVASLADATKVTRRTLSTCENGSNKIKVLHKPRLTVTMGWKGSSNSSNCGEKAQIVRHLLYVIIHRIPVIARPKGQLEVEPRATVHAHFWYWPLASTWRMMH